MLEILIFFFLNEDEQMNKNYNKKRDEIRNVYSKLSDFGVAILYFLI